MATSKRKAAGGKSRKRPPPNVDLLEQYSPYRVAKILATSTKKKEDPFESLIPKDGTCLDYNVSETFLRMDAGDTKINVRETIATYVPAPPEMIEANKMKQEQRTKHGRGVPPQWVFADEIWLQKQNEMQEVHKRGLKKFVKQRKKNDSMQGRGVHHRILSMVGPDWFQELSPKQMRTVGQLEACILKDIKDGTIINTQENVGNLGLVLRPNHNFVTLALRLCCKCPVEFLLILYQLIDPNRSQYSLNDRLLLSAVVHLTMTKTLRELHVRMPSPPKPEKVPVKPPKRPKEKMYISPYLKPYTFKPTPRKYTGIYENTHVQYPESSYFAYRESLILERIISEDVLELETSDFEPEEQELIDEWRQAQLIYDQIQNGVKIKLIRPSILTRCTDFKTYVTELIVQREHKNEIAESKGDANKVSRKGQNIAAGGRVGAGEAGTAGITGGTTKGAGGFGRGMGAIGDVGGIGVNKGDGTARNKGGGGEREPELILPPLAILEDDDNKKCECVRDVPRKTICAGCKDYIIKPCDDCKRPCNCREITKWSNKYNNHLQRWIGGVVTTKGGATVPVVSGIIPPKCFDWVTALEGIEKGCECGRIAKSEIPVFCEECKKQCKQACDCKQQTILYTTPKCGLCLEKVFKGNTQKWIGGITMTKSNTAVPIISGLVPPKICDCLDEYKNKVMAVAARDKLQLSRVNFIVGGVAITKGGPVYMLSAALRKKKKLPEIPKRVCKAIEDKGDAEPRPKRTKFGPHECTCGLRRPRKADDDEDDDDDDDDDDETSDGVNDSCRFGNVDRGHPEEKKDDEESKKCSCRRHKSAQIQDFEFSNPCSCQESCICQERSKLVTDNKCEKCVAKRKLEMVEKIIGGIQAIDSENFVPIVQGTRLQGSCECLQDYKEKLIGMAAKNRIKSRKARFVVAGVASTKEGPVYILSTAVGKKPRKVKRQIKTGEEEKECVCKEHAESSEDELDDDPFKYSSCRCKEALDKFLAHKCTCEKCNVKERQRTATYIKGGMKYTGSGNVINILSGVHSQQCDCLERYLEKISALEDYRKRIEARYRLKSRGLKFAIGGVVNTPNGPVYVISGMRPPVECECARVLQEKLAEQLQQSRMPKMPPTGRIKYEIAGVKQMSEENVYIVNQALAIDDCDCVKLYNRFEEAHRTCLSTYDEYLKQVEDAVNEYTREINGEPKEENNWEEQEEFVLTDTYKETADEQPFQSFVEEGGFGEPFGDEEKNIEQEEERAEEREEEREEFDSSDSSAICTCKQPIHDFYSDESVSTAEYTASTTTSESGPPSIPPMELKFTESGKIDTFLPIDDEGADVHTAAGKTSTSKVKTAESKTVDSKATEKKSVGGKTVECKATDSKTVEGGRKVASRSVGGKTDDVKKVIEAKQVDDKKSDRPRVDENQELKRFLILRKIPCKQSEQEEILKKMLSVLAEDGYPLAKLPDCHKLPHFKLWMHMRCGKFWTQKDRGYFEQFSKIRWCHTNICKREIPSPKLGIDKAKAKLMTWKDVASVRKIVCDNVGMYYRLVRQENIEEAREFFPLTFDYEFPTTTFRDCYFAYLPSKEEDVLVYRIVKPHEARVNLKKFPCY